MAQITCLASGWYNSFVRARNHSALFGVRITPGWINHHGPGEDSPGWHAEADTASSHIADAESFADELQKSGERVADHPGVIWLGECGAVTCN